jgi:hypothetical protein
MDLSSREILPDATFRRLFCGNRDAVRQAILIVEQDTGLLLSGSEIAQILDTTVLSFLGRVGEIDDEEIT